MAKTPITHTTTYLPVGEFLKRADLRTVGDLCSDREDGTRVSQAELLTNANLIAALVSASGLFESAVFRGGRYTIADLLALPSGSASQGLMYMVLADVTVASLFKRRPTLSGAQEAMEQAGNWLKALSEGEQIFSFQETAAAGVMEVQEDTTQDVDARDGITVITKKFFGRRANRWPKV